MEQSPSWEAKSHSTSRDIPRVLQNPKVHYCVHKITELVLIQSQEHPVHSFPFCFPKIYSNIVFPSTPTFSEWFNPHN
jgi:hypothetical protein